MTEKPDWYLAVRVPAGGFEELLALTYRLGGQLREIAPEYREQIEEATKALNGAVQESANGKVAPRLTDESKLPKAEGLRGTCKGFLFKRLRRTTRTSAELRQLARDANVDWSVKGIDSRLYEMKQEGFVTLTMKGWELTAAGRKASKQALWQKPPGKTASSSYTPRGDQTQAAVLLAFLEKHYPNSVILQDTYAELAKHNMRPKSASTVLHHLKTKGWVAHNEETASYAFIPPENRQQQGDK